MKFTETAEEAKAREERTMERIKAQQERGIKYRAELATKREQMKNCKHQWKDLPKMPGVTLQYKRCTECDSMRMIDSGD